MPLTIAEFGQKFLACCSHTSRRNQTNELFKLMKQQAMVYIFVGQDACALMHHLKSRLYFRILWNWLVSLSPKMHTLLSLPQLPWKAPKAHFALTFAGWGLEIWLCDNRIKKIAHYSHCMWTWNCHEAAAADMFSQIYHREWRARESWSVLYPNEPPHL